MQIQTVTIVDKIEIIDGVFEFLFELETNIEFSPGQYVIFKLDPTTFRAYSIVDLKDKKLILVIDTGVGGKASTFFAEAKKGSKIELIGEPKGDFLINKNDKPKVFVATGTGVAPFIPMIKSVLSESPKLKVTLLFGARYLKNSYVTHFFEDFGKDMHPNFKILKKGTLRTL